MNQYFKLAISLGISVVILYVSVIFIKWGFNNLYILIFATIGMLVIFGVIKFIKDSLLYDGTDEYGNLIPKSREDKQAGILIILCSTLAIGWLIYEKNKAPMANTLAPPNEISQNLPNARRDAAIAAEQRLAANQSLVKDPKSD